MIASLPLTGVTVLDLTQIYNGPYATYLMALAGADVVKIEPPDGEPLRRRGEVGGAALPFAMLNGCKRSVVLDLKSEAGKIALRRLASDADVLVENFAPGVMERLELGPQSLMAANPKLIYASSTGFGGDGPYRNLPAMDLTVQAMGGVMETTGYPDRPPVKAGPAIADFAAGTHLYGAIATALFERERSGIARRVEVAMQDAIYATLSSSLGLHWTSQGASPPRTGNRHGGLAEAPYNVYATRDGYIALICVGEAQFVALAKAMNREDLPAMPEFATLHARVRNIDALDGIVEAWTRGWTTADLFAHLIETRVPCAPVRTLDEVVNDPNMHARGALEWQHHPRLGRIVVQQSPMRYAGAEPRRLTPSSALGADTDTVLSHGFQPIEG